MRRKRGCSKARWRRKVLKTETSHIVEWTSTRKTFQSSYRRMQTQAGSRCRDMRGGSTKTTSPSQYLHKFPLTGMHSEVLLHLRTPQGDSSEPSSAVTWISGKTTDFREYV